MKIKAKDKFGKVHYLTPKVRWVPRDKNDVLEVNDNLMVKVDSNIYIIVGKRKTTKKKSGGKKG